MIRANIKGLSAYSLTVLIAKRFELTFTSFAAVEERKQHEETLSYDTLREFVKIASSFALISIGKKRHAYVPVSNYKNSKHSERYSSIVSGLDSLIS